MQEQQLLLSPGESRHKILLLLSAAGAAIRQGSRPPLCGRFKNTNAPASFANIPGASGLLASKEWVCVSVSGKPGTILPGHTPPRHTASLICFLLLLSHPLRGRRTALIKAVRLPFFFIKYRSHVLFIRRLLFRIFGGDWEKIR